MKVAYSTSSAFYTATATYDASVIWSLKTVAGMRGLFNIIHQQVSSQKYNVNRSKSSYLSQCGNVTATPPDLTDEQAVTINITDLNDEAPVFKLVAASFNVMKALGQITAAPDVSGATVTYTLSGADASDLILASTGVVTKKSTVTFDHETQTSYSFTVTATVGSGQQRRPQHIITVNITDLNDEPHY